MQKVTWRSTDLTHGKAILETNLRPEMCEHPEHGCPLATLGSELARADKRMKPLARGANPELKRVMQLYVKRFNRRDWDGVRELVSADDRLNAAERFAGKFADATYFFNYERWPVAWKLALGEVDGEPVVIMLERGGHMDASLRCPPERDRRINRAHHGLRTSSLAA
jgi:hypothetical protein